MEMSVNDVAGLFRVSSDTVHRWISEAGLPASKFNDRFHVNRVRLLEWAHDHQIALPAGEVTDTPLLAEALVRGGVYHDVEGANRAEALGAAVERMPLPPRMDRAFLFEMLLARERLGSTGLGGGVAVPHARNPILLRVDSPLVMLCYLKQAVDFEAPDGKPVFALFTMAVPVTTMHLRLLAQLGTVLQDQTFAGLVHRRAGLDELLNRIHAVHGAARTTAAM